MTHMLCKIYPNREAAMLASVTAEVRALQYQLLHDSLYAVLPKSDPDHVHPDWLVVIQGEYNRALAAYRKLEAQLKKGELMLE